MKRWIGLDPGCSGAIAMIPEVGEVEIYPLEHGVLLEKLWLWQYDDCKCCLEHVSSSPQMGVTSSFTFGDGWGYIKGALEALKIPYELVRPVKWKGLFSCNLGKDATQKEKKEKDLETARRLFPTVSFRKTERSKTDWTDAADALLMAEYCRRVM